MHITFHGAAGGVTGSKHLLETGAHSLLVDCGLFQGPKDLRQLNWKPPRFDVAGLDAILLTHAHLDHTGWLPRLLQYGLRAPVYCTEATAELAELILLDSAHLQEEDAAWANKKKYSKHQPALPLYTTTDALAALKRLRPVRYEQWHEVVPGVRVRWHLAGHILGASFLELAIKENGRERTVVFSGDLGRYDEPLHHDPAPRPDCDVLVIESTYGDRLHDHEPVEDQIGPAFKETIRRRGVVLIPAFAVGRVQLVTLILRELMKDGDLPEVPIHIDSPMAIDATAAYSRHLLDHTLDEDLTEEGRKLLFPHDVLVSRTVHDSKRINALDGPMVIVSSSGMMTGGRILHHLTRRVGKYENLILLSGYQAVGTRGRALQDGAKTLRIHGDEWPIVCKVLTIHGLSAHGDWQEMMRWAGSASTHPRTTFVVHGEPSQAEKFAVRMRAQTGGDVHVPTLGQSFEV